MLAMQSMVAELSASSESITIFHISSLEKNREMQCNEQHLQSLQLVSAASVITVSCSSSIPMAARHCRGHKCFCQYIEEHLKYKPVTTCSMLAELFRS
ncbi:hypothetical protein TYRP_021346 [Tyrophagus putrescentiae]|nr:hypothetical protein TYRP_021346 [Tyrophagus putrescentiae]